MPLLRQFSDIWGRALQIDARRDNRGHAGCLIMLPMLAEYREHSG
jgi:hypothetical protein